MKSGILRSFLRYHFSSVVILFLHCTVPTFGQYAKNPLQNITNDGYNMIVEKFAKIPFDFGNQPRINTFTYVEDRIFVATERAGKIYEIVKEGNSYKPILFLDVAAAILQKTGRNLDFGDFNAQHAGLRSVAFHPEFTTNGKFYTSLMEDRPSNTSGHIYLSDVKDPIQYDGVVIEWTYDLVAKKAIQESYRELFRVGMPVGDHTIKEVKFNRYAQVGDEDYGLLYITHGDGSQQSAVAGGGQNNDARGKVLRINPLQSGDSPYTIPSSNPFVTNPDWLDEIYTLGHRNPHTICFDKDATGKVRIIVGEVGRDNMEEVNILEKGGDYGWPQREGTYVHLGENGQGIATGIRELPDSDATNGFIYPAAQWSHTGFPGAGYVGQAIAGGYVYTVPDTKEKLYLCSDFAFAGRVFQIKMNDLTAAITKLDTANPDLNNPRDLTQAHIGEVNVFFDHDNDTSTNVYPKSSMKDVLNDEPDYDAETESSTGGRADLRFGQDQNENVYIMNKRNGWVYKIQSISLKKPDTTHVHLVAGLESYKNKNQFSAYPNPVSKENVLHLSFSESPTQATDVFAVSLEGKKWYLGITTPGIKTLDIDLNEKALSIGYYIIHVYSDHAHASYPVIVK